jgi:hypothetical protein
MTNDYHSADLRESRTLCPCGKGEVILSERKWFPLGNITREQTITCPDCRCETIRTPTE